MLSLCLIQRILNAFGAKAHTSIVFANFAFMISLYAALVDTMGRNAKPNVVLRLTFFMKIWLPLTQIAITITFAQAAHNRVIKAG